MAVKFLLRTERETGTATIYTRFRAKGSDFTIATGLKIAIKDWDDDKGAPKGGRVSDIERVADIRTKLATIANVLSQYENLPDVRPSLQGTKRRIEEALGHVTRNTKKRRAKQTPSEYITQLIDDMANGVKVTGIRKTQYQASTVRAWRVFSTVFNNFLEYYESREGDPLGWNDIDGSVGELFLGFCNLQGFMRKTTNKYIKSFKALIRYAAQDGLHNNLKCLEEIGTVCEDPGTTQTEVVLTENEIQALYEMPLEPGEKMDVRDLFLVGCYTGQRFSDFSRIARDNFTTLTDKDGSQIPIIKLVQKKTNREIEMPIINDNLIAIMERHNYKLPNISDVVVNRYIKEICKELSDSVTTLKDNIETAITKKETVAEKNGTMRFERNERGKVIRPKYELVRTHTARRSLITFLAKETNLSYSEIMTISGHTTERLVRLYVKMDKDQDAIRMHHKINELRG